MTADSFDSKNDFTPKQIPLHADCRAFLDALAERPGPGWEEMPVAEARDTFASLTEVFGEGPADILVDDLTTDGGVAVRTYRSPRTHNDVVPAMMWFHGGGFVLGSIDTHDAVCRRLAEESGFAIVSVEYRLSPEHKYPDPFQDCYDATTFVIANADRLMIDAEKVVVAGDSAGGNLAAAVALKARDSQGPSIAAQVLVYPVIDADLSSSSYDSFAVDHGLTRNTMQYFWDSYLPQGEQDAYAIPANSESLSNLPPTIVVTAGYDVLRDEGLAYAQRLQEAGVPVSLMHYGDMLHGFLHFAGAFSTGIQAAKDICDVLRTMECFR